VSQSGKQDNTAEVLEREKLEHEVANLKRPFWREPATVGSVIAFLVSAALNVGQYLNARAESERKDRDLVLRTEESAMQRMKLQAEVDRLRQQIKADGRSAESCSSAGEELARIAEDIQYLNGSLPRDKAELAKEQQLAERLEKQGQAQWAEAARRGVATIQGWVEKQSLLLDQALKRRSELEQRCK
jgi:hypothetical protein